MGSSIGFFAAESDTAELQRFVESLSLTLVAPLISNKVAPNPADGPFCYLSPVGNEALHPYGSPAVKVSDATDPLLVYIRSFTKENCVVLGQLHWTNDVPNLAKITAPYYKKIAAWIRKNWRKEGDFYLGPQAEIMVKNGSQLVGFPPGEVYNINIVKV